MALTGYGLQPSGWEKNLKRSASGGYGALNRQPASDALANMTREKYAAGLRAKQDKDQFDFAKQKEATRHGEWGDEFGFAKDKWRDEFGFEKARWQDELGLSQQDLDLARDKLEMVGKGEEYNRILNAITPLLNLGYGESDQVRTLLDAMMQRALEGGE